MCREPLPLVVSAPPAPPTSPRLGFRPSHSHSLSAPSLSLSRDKRCLLSRDRSVGPWTPRTPRCSEVAGGTAAGFAVCCCCFPCGLVNLLFTAVVRLPAGICRKAIRQRKMQRRRSARAALIHRRGGDDGEMGSMVAARGGLLASGVGVAAAAAMLMAGGKAAAVAAAEVMPSEEMVEMEKEMWDLFYGTGFWRSPSQRE